MNYLVQAYRDNWALYQQALLGSPSVPGWDICVLTAANIRQASAYELQIEQRRRKNLLPPSTRWLVVPDPEGQRIGSGGATLNVLRHVLALLDPEGRSGATGTTRPSELLRGKRILIVHSGGDSKRLPHYSAFGKLFARLPHELPDGRASSLFDEFIVSLSGLPQHMYEGVVIASGDVLLVFDHLQLDFNRQGVVGVGMNVPVGVGTRHGVFVADPATGKVRQFLHKPPIDRLEAIGAINPERQVTVDTGIVWFDPEVAGRLVEMAGVGRDDGLLAGLVRTRTSLNLYGDFLCLLPPATSQEEFLNDESDGPLSRALQAVREQLWEAFRGVSLSVQTLKPARFIHFGSTVEYRDSVFAEHVQFSEAGWSSNVESYSSADEHRKADADLILISSFVRGFELHHEGEIVIDDSLLTGPTKLGRGVVLTGVRHTEKAKPLVLSDDLVLHQLPVRANNGPAWVSRVYGVSDNPKKKWTEPGATFLNRPWGEWLERTGLSDADLWDGIPADERTLWNATLYPVAETPAESWRLVEWIQRREPAPEHVLNAWKRAKRLSLKESYHQADLDCILELTRQLQETILIERFLEKVGESKADFDSGTFPGEDPEEIQHLIDLLLKRLDSEDDALFRMRALKIASDRLVASSTRSARIQGEALEERAFSELATLIRESTRLPVFAKNRKEVNSVLVESPARIDLGGGWSDTAPFSIEQGGTVLNAAIALKGSLPVRVAASWLDEPVFVLESTDLGVRKRLHVEDLLAYHDLSDPLALHKAALVSMGLENLDDRGIYLKTEIGIPKGSGLGTSSIMASAVLSALNYLTGRAVEEHLLFDQVFGLEQMLTTGGGWQDQVGGVVGGLKLIRTKPGLPQVPEWEHVPVPESLQNRLFLIYTGQRRLAKRILRSIMGGYISRAPDVTGILFEIQDLSCQMANAIQSGDTDELGRLLALHWKANIRLDPGSTNPFINELFERLGPMITGGKLAGAGGGGFAIVVARDGTTSGDLSRFLEEAYQDSEVRLWPCRIVDEGLKVTLNPVGVRSNPDVARPVPG